MGGICKAQGGSGYASRRSPVLESDTIRGEAVRANPWLTAGRGPCGWAYGCPGQQVRVDRHGQMKRMNVNVVCGDREACSYFSLDAQRDLLRHRALVVILSREENRSRRQGPGVGNSQPKLRQIRGRNAGKLAGRWLATTDDIVLRWVSRETLEKQRLENL